MSGERPGSDMSGQEKVLKALERIRQDTGRTSANVGSVEPSAPAEFSPEFTDSETESNFSPAVDPDNTQYYSVEAAQGAEDNAHISKIRDEESQAELKDPHAFDWLSMPRAQDSQSNTNETSNINSSGSNESFSAGSEEVYDDEGLSGGSGGDGRTANGAENGGGGRRKRWAVAGVAAVALLGTLYGNHFLDQGGEEENNAADLTLSQENQNQPTEASQPKNHKEHKQTKHHKHNKHNKATESPSAEPTQQPTQEPKPEPTKKPEPKYTPPPPPPPPPTALELVHRMPLDAKLGQLTQLYISEIEGVLPTYQTTDGESQLNDLRGGLIGGVYITPQPISDIGLVGSASKEINTNGVLPADAVYGDATLSEKKVDSFKDFKQLPSISALIEHGMSLDHAMELYEQHYDYLKQQGIESVNISGKLPEKYVTETRKRIVKRVGKKGHRHKKVHHKTIKHNHPIDPLVAAQYVKAQVQAAEKSGLDAIVGSFSGVTSEDDSKGFVFAQKAGADIRVSGGLADTDDVLPPSIDALTYSTLDNLDNKTTTYTGVLSETNFEPSDPKSSPNKYVSMPMAQAAVAAMVAGADRVTVKLPEDTDNKDHKTPVSEWLKDFKSVAQMAIKSSDLSVKDIDRLVLEKLQQENISPKKALKKIHKNR